MLGALDLGNACSCSYKSSPQDMSQQAHSFSARHAASQGGVRDLLAVSRQSKLTATGSGMLDYQPIGYHIDGADFTQFVLEAHANVAVTGV